MFYDSLRLLGGAHGTLAASRAVCLSEVLRADPLGWGELWGAAITLAPVFPYQVQGRCRCNLKIQLETYYLHCSLQRCVRIGGGHTERVFLKEPLAHENKEREPSSVP